MSSKAGGAEGDEAPTLLDELPEPLDREAIPRLLDPYGYVANSAYEWGMPPIPELSLQVSGHRKVGGHVYYHLEGALAKPGQWHSPYFKWQAARRLGHLREGLHDPVKRELGSDYRARFEGAHFAHKVAVKGTTGRLDTWCKKLAQCLNAKSLPPAVAATVLHVLVPPGHEPGEADDGPDAPSAEEGVHLPPGSVGAAGAAAAASGATAAAEAAEGDSALNPFAREVSGGDAAAAPAPAPAAAAAAAQEEKAEAASPGGAAKAQANDTAAATPAFGAADHTPGHSQSARTGSEYSDEQWEQEEDADSTGSEEEASAPSPEKAHSSPEKVQKRGGNGDQADHGAAEGSDKVALAEAAPQTAAVASDSTGSPQATAKAEATTGSVEKQAEPEATSSGHKQAEAEAEESDGGDNI